MQDIRFAVKFLKHGLANQQDIVRLAAETVFGKAYWVTLSDDELHTNIISLEPNKRELVLRMACLGGYRDVMQAAESLLMLIQDEEMFIKYKDGNSESRLYE